MEVNVMKHTNGPWEVTPVLSYEGHMIYRQIKSINANVYKSSIASTGIDELAEANAHLIAAAPELLEALQAVDDYAKDNETKGLSVTKPSEVFDLCQQAIKKAPLKILQ